MKKGFTLLELLAVVIVLAIVTLIAVPIIANVIDKAKQGSAVDSAYGYIDTIEKNVALGKLDSNKGVTVPNNNVISMSNIDEAEMLDSMSIKGTKPEYVELNFEKSKVVSAGFCIDGYNIEYKNKKAKLITNPDDTNNYCKKANVKEIIITNTEEIGLTWNPVNHNEGQIAVTSGKSFTLDLSFITKDGKQPDDVEITTIPADSHVITIDGNTVTANSLGSATILITAGIRYKKIVIDVTNDSILGYLQVHDFGATGETEEITITANNTEYKAHVYNYEGDQEWTTETVPNGGKFGSADDIGAASTNATKMVIVKVNGDLTIGSGVTIQPNYSAYGGPKGFVLYVTGTLTNNGRVDNSHGAKAAGQKVYLWQNAVHADETDEFEFVPAAGGGGGAAVSLNGVTSASGKAGGAGSGRGTGGGGSGGAHNDHTANISGKWSGAGSAGTSYSGGSGGGGHDSDNNGSSTVRAGNAGGNGGAGGVGKADRYNKGTRTAGGGAGNPGGNGAQSGNGTQSGNNSSYKGANGTGGLLIVYANNITNSSTGTFTAVGAAGHSGHSSASGGSSGGGSINIFYSDSFTNNNTATNALNVNGGSTAGAGGKGTVTIGSIADGTFRPN